MHANKPIRIAIIGTGNIGTDRPVVSDPAMVRPGVYRKARQGHRPEWPAGVQL
jgi:hypothetical protein